jgi:hypothetical protein
MRLSTAKKQPAIIVLLATDLTSRRNLMFQKKALSAIILTLVLCIILAACSSTPLAGLTQTQASSSASASVTSKLGVGILKMEGTSEAVTPSQASTLLPLWKAVYKMGNDKSASSAEVAALYTQIQESLTTEQISTIQQMALTQQELSDLTQKYGSTPVGQTASASTSSSASSSQQNAGGAPDMGGGPMSDITSVGLNNSGSNSSTTTSSKTSATTAKVSQASSSSNLNPVFASAIITVLKERVTLD